MEPDHPRMIERHDALGGRFSIDVVIPVYNAPEDVRRCVDSVLGHAHDDCRITLIDDASPDAAIAALFDELEARRLPQLRLLRNARNLGFIGTANRGIEGSRADVVLLNSDTVVTGDWLQAFRDCAASDARIGTITPFSNNAEICSFPRFCVNNTMDGAGDPEAVSAAISAAAVPTYPDLPTGVGFCMFIRRALIDEVGDLDLAFGAGYGEENDLCLRAARAGWRNVLADNAFVLHVGGRSFAGQKADLSPRNTAILLERHPHYTRMVEDYIKADPLRALREAAAARLAIAIGPSRGVLHVIHDHGGGTETHVRALIEASRDRWRHYLAIAVRDEWQVEEHRADGSVVTFDLERRSNESWRDFLGAICTTFGIALIHLHNVSACRDGLLTALRDLGIPYGYTVHDLNFACPTITFLGRDGMYCGGQTDAEMCTRCLGSQPAFRDADIVAWRGRHGALVDRAAFLLAPSRWAAAMLERYFPGNVVHEIAHGTRNVATSALSAATTGLALPDDGIPTVAVLGAIGPDKGARRIERLVALARKGNKALRFVLIGYLDVQHTRWQADDARFTVHGRYDHDELPGLLAHYRVALVLYPSAGPETFSYTLSEAWAAGVPALVPPIGALAERVGESGAGWVMSDAEWRDGSRMLDRIESLVGANERARLRRAGDRARAMPHATLAAMAGATLAVYENALAHAGAPRGYAALTSERVRNALGYRPWSPPSLATPANESATSPQGLVTRAARAALTIRHTPFGRALFRITPRPLRNALKARLRT
jgi:GT2 family glycosyltransferase/glycosyltransferase involved in cell wall biosynthesis